LDIFTGSPDRNKLDHLDQLDVEVGAAVGQRGTAA
jgi:hypothetical protein